MSFYDTLTKEHWTIPNARYVMEQHLDRTLERFEFVDHINGDCTNDAIDNLQLLTPKQNSVKRNKQLNVVTEMYYFDCPVCDEWCSIPYYRYKAKQIVKGSPGPFCSKSCAAKARHLRGKDA